MPGRSSGVLSEEAKHGSHCPMRISGWQGFGFRMGRCNLMRRICILFLSLDV